MAFSDVCRNEADLQCIDLNWSNQLEIFKIALGVESLNVKYIDEENEEVGLHSQQDYDYALELAASKDRYLNLIFKDNSGLILSKHKFYVSQEQKTSVIVTDEESKPSNQNHKWLEIYLNKFKKDILTDMEIKMKEIVQTQTPQIVVDKATSDTCQHCNSRLGLNQHFYDLNDCSMPVDEKTNKLLRMLLEARLIDRPLKKAYIEEELQLSGAFNAEFVTDINMRDGTKCPPNRKFQKQWLIKNTGKLAWDTSDKFQVQLVCIGGNISTLNEERVNVSATEVNATVQVNVNLVTPNVPGEFYTEWAFVCRGFQFGPRLWCAIEVVEKELAVEDKQMCESFFSDDQDDEFVVLPDCLDLSKNWRPDFVNKHLEDSYLEIEAQIDKTLLDLSKNYETSDSHERSYVQCDKSASEEESGKNEEPFEQVKQTSCSESFEEVSTPGGSNSAKSSRSTSIQVDTNGSVETREATLNDIPATSSEPESPSSFDVIKNSLGNLSGPSNIGDARIDLPKVQLGYTLPDNSTCSKFPIHSLPARLNNSVAQLTNAIGSLGSIYQSSNESDTNMKTLISMGFANRTLNSKLLKKHENDMDKVLGELLEKNDNNWHQHR